MRTRPKTKGNHLPAEIVFTRGKPSAVIIPLAAYRDMLTRLEDAEDLKILKRLRRKPLRFRSLDAFLKDTASRV